MAGLGVEVGVLGGSTRVLVGVGGSGVGVGGIDVAVGAGAIVGEGTLVGVSDGSCVGVSIAWTGANGWVGKPPIKYINT
jgi:hypothetical protein